MQCQKVRKAAGRVTPNLTSLWSLFEQIVHIFDRITQISFGFSLFIVKNHIVLITQKTEKEEPPKPREKKVRTASKRPSLVAPLPFGGTLSSNGSRSYLFYRV